jgi:hypothetical protein
MTHQIYVLAEDEFNEIYDSGHFAGYSDAIALNLCEPPTDLQVACDAYLQGYAEGIENHNAELIL